MRVVHYINQFFGGIGGEDKADAPLEFRDGAVGPGLALKGALGGEAEVVRTIVCGDNAFHDDEAATVDAVLDHLRDLDIDLLVAGPAFNAGRYGLACGAVCSAASERLGIPSVAGLYPGNPAVEIYRESVVIVPTAGAASGMVDAMKAIASVGRRLAAGETLGPAALEGIIDQGVRRNWTTDVPAAARAVDMLLAKIRGDEYQSEIPVQTQAEKVSPAPPLPDLSSATVALVTEGGLVPHGNPDNIESSEATRWAHYPISRLEDSGEPGFASIHGGYDSQWVDEDPDRMVPVDAARTLEREGVIGKLHDHFYVTVGTGMSVRNAERIGAEIARSLIDEGVQAAILTST